MNVKCCIKLLPAFARCLNQAPFISLNAQKSLFQLKPFPSYNLTLSVRHIVEDASKTEIPEGRIRVYYGTLTTQIRTVKWFSLTTSLIGIMAQPFLYKELAASQNLPLVIAACSFVGIFTFVTPVLLHYITKKYITHLDYKPDTKTYVATTVNFFSMLKETEFKVEDVKVPDIPGMFTSFEINGKGLFLDPRLFEDPSHYAKIMGYDKPIDFKLYEQHPNEKEK